MIVQDSVGNCIPLRLRLPHQKMKVCSDCMHQLLQCKLLSFSMYICMQNMTEGEKTEWEKKETLQHAASPARAGRFSTYLPRVFKNFLASRKSQSVTRSGLSPVLKKYRSYLQSCYKARVLAPADKYLPTLNVPYINLAIVGHGHCAPEERDEFTRRTLHGGVDEILQKKTPVNIEDLLTPEESGRPVRFVLVEGPPGIGKSTFAWEVCRRWDEIESLRDYHTVVLLKLREKWVLNATSPCDLFRYPPDPALSKAFAKTLNKSHGCNLLLVLDGFDEISHNFHKNSIIKSILCRELLPECTIILTTRPVAMYTLRSICQPQVDKHVEIIGFTEEERVRYITEVFSKEPELQVNFMKYMFVIPHIKSMMYIPLNCAIIAQVYYESQRSRHLAIPSARTELYKTLTHSLLVRHMKINGTYCESIPTLPEGLDEQNIKNFKILAKFAFDSYHQGKSRKVTFFKEDIPEGLVHFGFMNESTEMYAGKGVEQTFSFLHLSLQEYLAAWHLADSYSIEFQVAYHRLATSTQPSLEVILTDSDSENESIHLSDEYVKPLSMCKGDIEREDEEALIFLLEQQRSLLVEPAIFLAGVTGWRCQSEDDRNHWEVYLSDDTIGVGNASVLLRSLYEAQNASLCPYYFADCDDSCREFFIGSLHYHAMSELDRNPHTPYDCYAFSYCLANSSDQLWHLSFGFNDDNDIPLVETFVKGLEDHCLSTIPRVKCLQVKKSYSSLINIGLLWLMKANFLATVEESVLDTSIINNSGAQILLQSLVNLKSLKIHENEITTPTPITSWEWLAALKSISKLNILHISSSVDYNSLSTDALCWLIEHRLAEINLDIISPKTEHDLQNPTDALVDCVLKSVLRSNTITKLKLPDISCDTMTDVHNILLHCPSLVTLELKRTRLGYDGILYMCSALRNQTLRHLAIHDCSQLPPFRDNTILPRSITCTDFLLQLSNIVKNNTLEVMNIQFDSFSTRGDGAGMMYELKLYNINSDVAYNVLQTMVKSQLLRNIGYCKLHAQQQSIKFLQKLHISNNPHINICNAADQKTDLNALVLANISCETMAGVHNVLLHCPSLATLELNRTRLGYDGILYICSALRNNTTLRHLVIHDDLQLPPSRDNVIFQGKTTCTDLLLQLSNIVKDNTLKKVNIRSSTTGDDEEMRFELKLCNVNSDLAHAVSQALVRIQLLKNVTHYEWLASPESLKHLQVLYISNKSSCYSQVNALDIDFFATTILPDICNAVSQSVDLILKFKRFNTIALSNVSRETMAGIHDILLHCPSLATLELKRTRLGYDGILYICSALRNNKTLRRIVIRDLQLPPSRKNRQVGRFTSFSSMKSVPLPCKTSCTHFLLELNNILKDNTTLEEIKIQSGLFLPLSAGEDWEYCQWTGLGPLQQFNVGAVGSVTSPNLRRSFSSSDLTQPQTTLFWDRWFAMKGLNVDINFKEVFGGMRMEEGKKLFPLPSFTALDTEVLKSFSDLDPRLKECLEISHLHQYVEGLRKAYRGLLGELKMIC